MALISFTGSFALRAGTGTQGVTGVGFVPKAGLYWCTLQTATGFGSVYWYSVGFDDATTSACAGSNSMNGQNTNAQAATKEIDNPDATPHAGQSVLGVTADPNIFPVDRRFLAGHVASWDADGFTMQWDINSATTGTLVNFVVFGGLGVSLKVGTFSNSGAGNQGVTGVGFQPTGVFLLPLAAGSNTPALGWAASASQQGLIAVSRLGGLSGGVTIARRYQRSTKCAGQLAASGAINFEGDFVSFDADGFTVHWTTVTGGTITWAYLAVTGCACAAGLLNQQTSTGAHATSGIGVTPASLLLLSANNTAFTTPQTNLYFSLGAFDGVHSGSFWVADLDNVSTTVTDRYIDVANVVTLATAPSTTNAQAVGQSLDVDGFTLNWTTVDATARSVLWFAMGVSTVTPPSPTDDPCAIQAPNYFIALQTANTGTVTTAAQRALRDPAGYYGAFKPPRLLSITSLQRSASDWFTGAWSAQSTTIKLADSDFYYRTLMGAGTPNDFVESGLWVYLISETQRRAGATPRLLFYGQVYDDPLSEGVTLTLEANDTIGRDYNLFGEETKLPKRGVTTADFPNLPSTSQGTFGEPLGVPIVYGAVSDETATTPKGEIKLINVGTVTLNGTDYVCGLLCGHAVKTIHNIYVDGVVVAGGDYGSSIFAPGFTGWSTIVPSGDLFVDINHRRYTIIPMLGAHASNLTGGKTYTVNVDGVEASAVGTGTLITDVVLQYQHLLVNWILGDYQSGGWLNTPTFDFFPGGTTVNAVDTTTFTAANNLVVSQFGGVTGGSVVGPDGRRESVRQVMQDIHLSFPNVLLRVDHNGQLGVVCLNLTRASFLSGKRTSDYHRDILSTPARTVTRQRQWQFNEVDYQFNVNYSTNNFDGTGTKTDAASITRYGRSIKTQRQYLWLRDSTSAGIVAQQQLNFAADPPMLYTWAETLCGLRNDVLDGVPITDYTGIGTTGYVNRAIWMLTQAVEPGTNKALMTGIDVDRLLS